jgi:hypothetical protein
LIYGLYILPFNKTGFLDPFTGPDAFWKGLCHQALTQHLWSCEIGVEVASGCNTGPGLRRRSITGEIHNTYMRFYNMPGLAEIVYSPEKMPLQLVKLLFYTFIYLEIL